MPNFLIPDKLKKDDTAVISGGDFYHITRVLRMKKGDIVSLFNSKNIKWRGVIEDILTEFMHIRILEKEHKSSHTSEIVLVQAVPRPGKMDTIIEKSTEMGISGILPLLTQRSWKWTKEMQEKRMERWKRKAYEAAKQSGGGIPELYAPIDLKTYLSSLPEEIFGLVLWEDEEKHSMKSTLSKCGKEPIHLVVGPEGGFAESEVSSFIEKGFVSARLPFPVLRVETASLAALAILCYEKS